MTADTEILVLVLVFVEILVLVLVDGEVETDVEVFVPNKLYINNLGGLDFSQPKVKNTNSIKRKL